MGNVSKMPGVPLTPRELVDKNMDLLNAAHSIALVIRDQDGGLVTLWSDQIVSQLLYSTRALNADVERISFGERYG